MLSDKTITGPGFRLIVASGTVTQKVRKAIVESLGEVGSEYRKYVLKNISLDDHSLEELRAMGHPYAVSKPADSMHSDDRLVHIQTGRLKSSIGVSAADESGTGRFSIYITSNDPAMKFLIYGTSRMRPRRFHEKAFQDIQNRFWDPVKKAISKVEHKISVSVGPVKF